MGFFYGPLGELKERERKVRPAEVSPTMWVPPMGKRGRLVVSGWQVTVSPQTQGPVWKALPLRGPPGFTLTP